MPPAEGFVVGIVRDGCDGCDACDVGAGDAAGFFFGDFAKLTDPSDTTTAHAASGARRRVAMTGRPFTALPDNKERSLAQLRSASVRARMFSDRGLSRSRLSQRAA